MRLGILLVMAGLFASTGNAVPLIGSINLIDADLDNNFDASTFLPGPATDLYEARLDNPNDAPVGTIQLEFFGDLQNFQPGGLTFRSDRVLPTFAPNRVAESFFVIPDVEFPNLIPDTRQTEDSGSRLAAQYTLVGLPRLIPANSVGTLVAMLEVPAGAPAPRFGEGRFVVDGRVVGLRAYPVTEPRSMGVRS